MNIKKLFSTAALFVVGCLISSQAIASNAPFTEGTRQAIKGAVDKMAASIKESKIDAETPCSILYINGDSNGYAESLVRDAFVSSGRTYVVPNDDENKLLQKIYSEIEFDERKDGMLDPITVDKINSASLKSTQVLIYGNIWSIVDNNRYTLVEISMCAYSVKTKEYLWSGSFDCRYYKEGKFPEVGIVNLPIEIRETLSGNVSAAITASLKKQSNIKNIKTVAVLPFVGDERIDIAKLNAEISSSEENETVNASLESQSVVLDGYVTHIAVDGLSNAGLLPKNLGAETRDELRRLLRDKPISADALLLGVVRSFDMVLTGKSLRSTTYEISVDVQLSIEDAKTHDVLWSDTILVREEYVDTISWIDWFLLDYPEAGGPAFYVGLLGRILLGLVVLIIICVVIRASTRVR